MTIKTKFAVPNSTFQNECFSLSSSVALLQGKLIPHQSQMKKNLVATVTFNLKCNFMYLFFVYNFMQFNILIIIFFILM